MPVSETDWPAPLREAYERPWSVAERWRRDGGRVVGVLGQLVPTEIIAAAGMLPVRLSARRLAALDAPGADLPEGLAGELSPETAPVLAALLGGELDWVDHLVIGRDSEAYTQLFYVLRELAGGAGPAGLPPFAFCDLLRQPLRTSARYNRLRCRELLEQVRAWSGREVAEADLAAAVGGAGRVADGLRALDALRVQGRITGSQALIAAGAAQVLPADAAVAALSQAAAAVPGAPPSAEPDTAPAGARIWVTGSAQDDLWAYRTLERAGARIVGEDHVWGDDGGEPPRGTRDPLDGIVDRCHHSYRGSARGRLSRIATLASRARERGAQGVLQLVFEHDEASGWEFPHLRAALEPIPVVQVQLRYGARQPAALVDALRGIAVVGGVHA